MWMLKTVCGGLYGGTMRADGFQAKDVKPRLDWLETLYGCALSRRIRPLLPVPTGRRAVHHRPGDCAIAAADT